MNTPARVYDPAVDYSVDADFRRVRHALRDGVGSSCNVVEEPDGASGSDVAVAGFINFDKLAFLVLTSLTE